MLGLFVGIGYAYDVLYKHESENKITSCIYVAKQKRAYFGDHEGKCMVLEFAEGKKLSRIETGVDSILFLHALDEIVYVIGPDSIKAVNSTLQSMKGMTELGVDGSLVGGGSLKKRLDDGQITASCIDYRGKKLFLAFGNGILVYDISDRQPKYLDMVKMTECCIKQLLFKKGHIFIHFDGRNSVEVWKVNYSPAFSYDQVQPPRYLLIAYVDGDVYGAG